MELVSEEVELCNLFEKFCCIRVNDSSEKLACTTAVTPPLSYSVLQLESNMNIICNNSINSVILNETFKIYHWYLESRKKNLKFNKWKFQQIWDLLKTTRGKITPVDDVSKYNLRTD